MTPKEAVAHVIGSLKAQGEGARTAASLVVTVVELLQAESDATVNDVTVQGEDDVVDVLRLCAADYNRASEALASAADVIQGRRESRQDGQWN